MKYRHATLRRMLAAEYALGTLSPRARRRFDRLLADDRKLRREVAGWEQRLAVLQRSTPQAPREVVWSGIERQLQRQQRLALPAAVPITADVRPLGRWRLLALAASLAAVTLGYGLWREQAEGPHIIERVRTVRVEVPVVRPVYAALLQTTAPAQWLVLVQPQEKRLKIMAAGRYPMDANRQELALWLLDESGTPQALALLPSSGVMEMPLPMELPTPAVLAVSLEPKGGSPTGQPSGPVVSEAPLLRL